MIKSPLNFSGVSSGLNKFMHKLQLGTYEHYKGGRYEVTGVAKHSETLEELVVYRAMYGEKQIWIRPLKMFMETVEVAGKKVPRFRFVGDK